MNFTRWMVAGVIGTWGLCASGGERTNAVHALTLTQTLQLAVQYNAEIARSELDEEGASGLTRSVRSRLLPKFDGSLIARRIKRSAAISGMSDDLSFTTYYVTPTFTSEPIVFEATPDPVVGPYNAVEAKIGASYALWDQEAYHLYREARENETAMAMQSDLAREQVLTLTARAYVECLYRQDAARYAEERVRLFSERVRLAEDLKGSGAMTELSVEKERLSLRSAEVAALKAGYEGKRALRDLSRAIGMPWGAAILLTDSLASLGLPALPEEDPLLEEVLERRADHRALLQKRAVLAERYRAVKLSNRPQVDLFGAAARQGEAADDTIFAWSVGAAMSVPIWDGQARRGRLAQALSELAQVDEDLAVLERDTEFQVRSARDRVAYAQANLELALQRVAFETRALKSEQDREGSGASTPLRVVAAMTDVAQAQYQAIDARAQWCGAQIEWLVSTGVAGQLLDRAEGAASLQETEPQPMESMTTPAPVRSE